MAGTLSAVVAAGECIEDRVLVGVGVVWWGNWVACCSGVGVGMFGDGSIGVGVSIGAGVGIVLGGSCILAGVGSVVVAGVGSTGVGSAGHS